MALSKFLIFLGLIGILDAQHDPNFASGNRDTIVHLFEWRWNDIAEECETFLGPFGYAGVQVSPVSENAVITEPFRPWYERYQTVSYQSMTTRSGTEQEFASMVRRCNAAGVRIYPDTIVNHMTGGNNAGFGTGGNFYNTTTREYLEYNVTHFNPRSKCPSASGGIEDWNDPVQVRNCELVGLADLDQSQEFVRDQIVNFMNKLIGYGVGGFRIDAAKHVWPEDMKAMMDRLDDLPTEHGFAPGTRPFIYLEVPGGYPGEGVSASDYYPIGRITEFNHGRFLGSAFRGQTPLSRLVNWGSDWGMHPELYTFLFNDNHDSQRGGGGNENVLTFRLPKLYKMATAFMFSHPYGVVRVMSSFEWEQNWEGGEDLNNWIGPPNRDGETLPVIINPDLSCGNGWVCEHRWPEIRNMAKFRGIVKATLLTHWWDNGNNQIAFSRGDKGFIAFNNEDSPLDATIQTGLPVGKYCDVYLGGKVNATTCMGNTVIVGPGGLAQIYMTNELNPVIAIDAESKLD